MELRFQRKNLRIFDASILDVRENNKRTRSAATPTPAQQVTALDLSHNTLTSVLNMNRLVQLTSLDLSWNSLTLNVSSETRSGGGRALNSLVPLPATLEYLNLSNNLIESVASIGPLFRLKWLSLANNPTLDERSLSLLPSAAPLQHLDISGCNITRTDTISHLANTLLRLNLSNNQISDIESLKALAGPVSSNHPHSKISAPPVLRHLGIDENPVASDPRLVSVVVAMLPMLETLNGAFLRNGQNPSSHVRISQAQEHDSRRQQQTQTVAMDRQRKEAVSSSPLDDTNVYDNVTTADESESASDAPLSFTPLYGLGYSASGLPQAQKTSRQQQQQQRESLPRTRHQQSSFSTSVDTNAIKLREMERLLVELTERENALKKKVGTQRLSLIANEKVRVEQDAKLGALRELEAELEAALGVAEAQLQQSQIRKAVSNETLLMQRLSYAI